MLPRYLRTDTSFLVHFLSPVKLTMKFLVAALLAGSAVAFAPNQAASGRNVALKETKDDLKTLAKECNPAIGFFDPIGLSDQEFWGSPNDATVGFLRESEVKHGRIAMFAFVGYIVHANGIRWPWPMEVDGTPFPDVTNPPEAWDAIPDVAKLQIMAFVGFLEYWRESACEKHYMLGGKVGEFPDFNTKYIPGGALNYFDPFKFSKNKSAADKEKGLVKEINNGRLAMLGIFGFACEAKIPGSVPALSGIVQPYDGEFMAPLTKSILPALPHP